jgi:hypothetical protein
VDAYTKVQSEMSVTAAATAAAVAEQRKADGADVGAEPKKEYTLKDFEMQTVLGKGAFHRILMDDINVHGLSINTSTSTAVTHCPPLSTSHEQWTTLTTLPRIRYARCCFLSRRHNRHHHHRHHHHYHRHHHHHHPERQ